MDADLINNLKNLDDRDKVIEVFDEARKVYLAELEPVLNKLKIVNKEMAIEMLVTQVELLNDSLAFATKFLTRDSTHPITAEQGLLLGSLNYTLKHAEL